MTQAQRYEGTWEEVNAQLAAHAAELRHFKRLSLVIEPEDAEEESEPQKVIPNEKALTALRAIARNQEGKRRTDGSQTERIIREGREGIMYDNDLAE